MKADDRLKAEYRTGKRAGLALAIKTLKDEAELYRVNGAAVAKSAGLADLGQFVANVLLQEADALAALAEAQ